MGQRQQHANQHKQNKTYDTQPAGKQNQYSQSNIYSLKSFYEFNFGGEIIEFKVSASTFMNLTLQIRTFIKN